ncbi:flagellar hook-length control protein FliK [Planctomycetota bacterium]
MQTNLSPKTVTDHLTAIQGKTTDLLSRMWTGISANGQLGTDLFGEQSSRAFAELLNDNLSVLREQTAATDETFSADTDRFISDRGSDYSETERPWQRRDTRPEAEDNYPATESPADVVAPAVVEASPAAPGGSSPQDNTANAQQTDTPSAPTDKTTKTGTSYSSTTEATSEKIQATTTATSNLRKTTALDGLQETTQSQTINKDQKTVAQSQITVTPNGVTVESTLQSKQGTAKMMAQMQTTHPSAETASEAQQGKTAASTQTKVDTQNLISQTGTATDKNGAPSASGTAAQVNQAAAATETLTKTTSGDPQTGSQQASTQFSVTQAIKSASAAQGSGTLPATDVETNTGPTVTRDPAQQILDSGAAIRAELAQKLAATRSTPLNKATATTLGSTVTHVANANSNGTGIQNLSADMSVLTGTGPMSGAKGLTPMGNNTPSLQRPMDIANQIVESMKTSALNNQKEIVIQLHPAELGRVTIRFSEAGNELTGVLEVSEKQTRQDLEQAIPQIIQSLESSGIQIKKLEVQLSDPQDITDDQQSPEDRDQASAQAQEDSQDRNTADQTDNTSDAEGNPTTASTTQDTENDTTSNPLGDSQSVNMLI